MNARLAVINADIKCFEAELARHKEAMDKLKGQIMDLRKERLQFESEWTVGERIEIPGRKVRQFEISVVHPDYVMGREVLKNGNLGAKHKAIHSWDLRYAKIARDAARMKTELEMQIEAAKADAS